MQGFNYLLSKMVVNSIDRYFGIVERLAHLSYSLVDRYKPLYSDMWSFDHVYSLNGL